MGVPRVAGLSGVEPGWLRRHAATFNHEPDFQREYHQGSHLVRLHLDDLEGEGSIEYWDQASRGYRTLADKVSFTAQPTTLTWVWNKQGDIT